jgi:hypothetical protein
MVTSNLYRNPGAAAWRDVGCGSAMRRWTPHGSIPVGAMVEAVSGQSCMRWLFEEAAGDR